MNLQICQRCLKSTDGVHTCTPTDLVRKLEQRVQELEAVIKSHGIPVKTATGGEAHYMMKDPEAKCNPHPDAPHGFMRNASLNQDRYVCECEYWEEPK